MNQERIFELAKQADLIQWDSLPSGARTPDHESVVKAQKFAQLIVDQCASIVSLYRRDNMQDKAIADTLEDAYREIKLSFGVKE